MIKKILCLLSSVFLVAALVASPISAKNDPQSAEINSYQMFWPLVAGKTLGDQWYSLKIFKENVRGLIIFGSASKSNYETLLATKRVLEAEKLVEAGKFDQANETLKTALSHLNFVDKNVDKAKLAGESLNPQEMTDRLNNLVVFTTQLSGKYNETRESFKQISQQASALLQKL